MKGCLCTLLFMALVAVSFGQRDSLQQPARRNSIHFNLGLSHNRFIDEGYTHSRLLFRGTNAKFAFGYGRVTTNYIFNFSVAASNGKVKSRSGNLPSDLFFVYPSIEYLRKVKKYDLVGKENEFSAGIHVSSITGMLQNESVIDNIDIFSLHGVYIAVHNDLKLTEKQSLHLTYLVPTAVFSNRVLWNSGASKFTSSDGEKVVRTLLTNGEFSYFAVFRNIQLSANYTITLSRRADFEIKYRFFYSDNFNQPPIHFYSNELLVGFKFKF